MQVILLSPIGVPDCALAERLEKRWKRLDPTLYKHPGRQGEIHGERLVRLWQDVYVNERGLREGDGKYLITENDFIIDEKFLQKLRTWPWPERAIFARYQMREKDSLALRPSEGLVGAWFIALNLRPTPKRWPPMDWLRPAGPYNDAANFAFKEAIESGFLKLREILWLDATTHASPVSVDYSLKDNFVGCHTFFAREFSAPKDKILLPQLPEYTAGRHVAEIQKYLDEVDA